MKAIASGLAATASVALFSATAMAQMACTARPDVLGKLARTYSEAPVAMGLAANGAIIEVLSSKEGQSWTIILTRPDGLSCVMAAGESWQPVDFSLAKIDPQS
ncbi:MAG: hypothetical protein VYB54_03005 [Pseudomonadota bacterium]|nr:hypothetical protein [Pseudomonadota bacterium]